MNIEVILIASVVTFAIVTAGIILWTDYKNKKQEKDMSEQIPHPKKSIKLLSADGTLLYEYNDVYIEYEDTNVYMLSRQYCGRCFLRIEKGTNMLLMVECYADDVKQDIKE